MSLDEIGTGSMSNSSTLGALELGEDTVEHFARIPRSRCDAEAHVREDLVRLAPREEARELISTDEEDRVLAKAAYRVDRIRRVVAQNGVARKRQLRELDSDRDGRAHDFVGWVRSDENTHVVELESRSRGLCDANVPQMRRVERPAE